MWTYRSHPAPRRGVDPNGREVRCACASRSQEGPADPYNESRNHEEIPSWAFFGISLAAGSDDTSAGTRTTRRSGKAALRASFALTRSPSVGPDRHMIGTRLRATPLR